MRDLDKFKGCLLGGAAGDALGYAVEFWDAERIFQECGEEGIREYVLKDHVAPISDDTQMTLFTANGLLIGTTRSRTRGVMGPYHHYIAECYKDWYQTQTGNQVREQSFYSSWLKNIPELHAVRAPGTTCLEAIAQGADGTIENPINQSKGCGGIMRVAPIGLYFCHTRFTAQEVAMIGAEAAAITHGHELGYIPAAALVHLIHGILQDPKPSLGDAAKKSIKSMETCFPGAKHMKEFSGLLEKAMKLSMENRNDLEAIKELGEGWVAEETLAIALYCALKYSDDFDKALVAAVNHSGDSDSTGAVTGNILGAYLGLSHIPKKYLENLELKDIILEMAEDLFHDCEIGVYCSHRDEVWERKYLYCDYAGRSCL